MKKLVLLLGLMILLSTMALADNISIENVKFFINDKETTPNADREININPNDRLELTVYYQSNFTNSSYDPKIEDVIVDVTIERIDDKNDLRDFSEKTTLSPNEKEEETFKFDIPFEVQEDEYDIIIEVEGEDENSTSQRSKVEYTLIIDKPAHRIEFIDSNFTEYNLTNCQKETILKMGIINTGEQEENIKLEIISDEIDLNYVESFKLEAGAYDGTQKYEENIKIIIPDKTIPSKFNVDIYANYGSKLIARSKYLYYNCDKVETKTINNNTVEVNKTENIKTENTTETNTEIKTNTTQTSNTEKVTTTSTELPKNYNSTLSVTKRTNESIFHDFTKEDNYLFYILIGGFILLLVIIIILLVVLL